MFDATTLRPFTETADGITGQKPGQLFVWTDGEDWVVAESAEDATAIVRESLGDDEAEPGPWTRKAPDAKL